MRPSVILQASAESRRSLRAVFDWRGDRYGHRIELLDEHGQATLLGTSHEELGDDGSTSSPPFQQLHLESRTGGQQVALLVGMSGKEHWSASVEIDSRGETLVFDVACRVGTPGISLRSTYLIADPSWNLEPLDCDGQLASVVRSGNMVTIAPTPAAARTARWKYRASLDGWDRSDGSDR